MRRPALAMVAAALLATGCERRDMSREEAIAAADAHVDKVWGSEFPRTIRRLAYERRTTWLIKYMGPEGSLGPAPTVELDKKSGTIVLLFIEQ